MYRVLLITLAAAFASVSHAEMVQYQFTDTNGELKTLPLGKKYFNPTSTMKIWVSAGLDNYVELAIKHGTTIIMTASSSKIGIDDKFTTDSGDDYYGAVFTSPTLPDGTYVFTQLLKDIDGNIIKTIEETKIIDTTPPTITGEIRWIINTYNRRFSR